MYSNPKRKQGQPCISLILLVWSKERQKGWVLEMSSFPILLKLTEYSRLSGLLKMIKSSIRKDL